MFRVEWLREAVDELAELWIEADSPLRQAITEATHALDKTYKPTRFGEANRGRGTCGFRSPILSHYSSKSTPNKKSFGSCTSGVSDNVARDDTTFVT